MRLNEDAVEYKVSNKTKRLNVKSRTR